MTTRPGELIDRTYKTLAALYRDNVTSSDPSLSQVMLLSFIKRHTSCTIEEIIERNSATRSSTYELCDRLIARGLIQSEAMLRSEKPGPIPARYTLTSEGIRALGRADGRLFKAERDLLRCLTPLERGVLLKALATIAYTKGK